MPVLLLAVVSVLIVGSTAAVVAAVCALWRLKRQRNRLLLALDVSKTGVFFTDLRRHKLQWSRYHELLFGFAEGTFDGSRETFRSRLHPDDRDWVVKRLGEARASGEAYEFECRVVWPDGSVHWVEARGQHFRPVGGGPATHAVGTVIETTERRRMEEALEDARRRAESANRAKSAFLANVSHELRTPLAVMLGFSEVLSTDLPAGSVEQTTALRILRNGEHLRAIIDDLLDLSRIEADKLALMEDEVQLPKLVDEVTGPLRERAAEKGLRLDVKTLADAPETVRTDPQRLRQILLNVVGNAVKFTDAGRIEVDLEPARAADGRRLVAIRVADTGIGVPPSAQESLFKPFSQVDASLSRRYGGTGLGLHLARQMARALGGDLELTHSAPGEGSVFTLTLDPRGAGLHADR